MVATKLLQIICGNRPSTTFKMARPLSELKKMQRTQLGRLTKDDLIDSIMATPLAREGGMEEVTSRLGVLISEVTELRKVITARDSEVDKKFDQMQQQIDKQAYIIERQQRYLEAVDRKERENNVVITGVPDEGESLEGSTTEETKLEKIWARLGADYQVKSHRRLGSQGSNNKRRPVLVTLENKACRDQVLERARQLKQAGGEFQKIYVKKDVHPSIRMEWKRLRDAASREKERPENAGCVIRLDTRERKLYRDGEVIDSWSQQGF